LEKPRNRMGRDLNWILCSSWKKWIGGTPLRISAIPSWSRPMRFMDFSNHEREVQRKKFEVTNGLQHVFEKWVERCKKCIACQGRYFEKGTVTAPPRNSDSE
jgi:hypothetical protein